MERKIYNPIQKDYVTFIKTSEETNGEYTLVELRPANRGVEQSLLIGYGLAQDG